MFLGVVQVIVLQVSLGRFPSFSLNFLCGFEDGLTQRASNFTRGRVPGVVDSRSPALFSFLRHSGIRRQGVFRVLTREDGREEVSSTKPCVDRFVRRLSRGLVLYRGEGVIFYLVLVGEFRVHFRVYRRTSRRSTQGSQDCRR